MSKFNIILNKDIEGSILDIGGGGEGIIGRIYKDQVTAIDKDLDELMDVAFPFKKLQMSAENLTFNDNSFDNITFFFSILYMEQDIVEKALSEAFRVLKKGGRIYIWDKESDQSNPNLLLADLNIRFLGEEVNVTYGSGRKTLNHLLFIKECLFSNGLTLIKEETENEYFHLIFEKK